MRKVLQVLSIYYFKLHYRIDRTHTTIQTKKTTYTLLTLLTLFTLLTQTLNAQWYWQQPIPTGNQFYCVKMVNSQTGYAAGVLGTIVKTTNGGLNWINLNSNTQTQLNAIDFIDANTGAAVGDSCIIVRTTNGGQTWIRTRLVTQSGATYFGGIDFIGNKTGYLVGGRDLSAQNYLFKTTNAGVTWIQLSAGLSNNLFCVSFLDTITGVVGGLGLIIKTTNGGTNWFQTLFSGGFDAINSTDYVDSINVYAFQHGDNIYKSTNGGNTWVYYPLYLGLNDLGRFASFANANTGLAVSSFGKIAKTTNGGLNWNIDSTFQNYDSYGQIFWGIDFPDLNNAITVGSGGKILRTTNGGSNWTIQNGFKKHLNSNFFTDVNTGYVVGDSGKILKTTNGGDSWVQLYSGTINRLNAIYFTSQSTGYIGGDTGVILKTTNAGMNWFSQTSGISGFNKDVNDIHFLNSDTGIFGSDSGKILKTTNGGIQWNIKYVGATPGVLGVWYLSSSIGVACSPSAIYRSTDGCENWYVQVTGTSGTGGEVIFSDSLNGYCGSEINSSFKTTNGGTNWIRIINSGADAAIYSVVSFDILYYGACSGGYIIKSTNSGLNWTRLNRITENNLNSVFFVNPNTGYVCGDFGTLLKTTNGGMTFIEKTISALPENISLFQNYPNPFNPKTVITYQLAVRSFISLKIYDVTGKDIKTLEYQKKNPGGYSVIFDGSDLPSGIYFYSLYADENLIETKKCLLIK